MKNNMFASLIEKPQTTKKWLLFPLSLLLHCAIIAGLLVVPLLSDGVNMPKTKMLTVSIITAPQPPPVQFAAKAKRGRSKDIEKNAETTPKPQQNKGFFAPPEIPLNNDLLNMDDIDEFGDPEGSEYGVEGGALVGSPDGVPGGVGLFNKDRSVINENPIPSHVTPPTLLKKINPTYPVVAIKAHVEGNVIIEAVTDLQGRVSRVRIISGHPLLQAAAVQAVKQWIYEPYIINGYPKPVIFTVNVTFSLSR